jgi:chromosome segregation ATPase
MDTVLNALPTAQLSVRNVGGIDSTTVEFEPGVNVLAGRNATNRTSLLRSVMAAIGSDEVSLKSNAEEGHVELRIGDETYTRHLTRENGSVTLSGDPYTDDTELADLFAFLLGMNEARRTVLTEQDLREVIMRPIDTQEVESEIQSLVNEKERISEELNSLSELQRQLPDLEQERTEVIAELEEKREMLADKQSELEQVDDGKHTGREEIERKMEQRGETKSELNGCERELASLRESLNDLRERRESLSADAEDLPVAPDDEISELTDEIRRLQRDKQEIQSEINALQQIIQFNEENLEGTSTDILAALVGEEGQDTITDRLTEDSKTIVCWTCGHEVDRADVEEMVSRLKSLRESKVEETNAIDERIDELETERITYQEKQRQREQVIEQLERTKQRISERESRIAELERKREELNASLKEIEREIETLQSENDERLRSLQEDISDLKLSITTLEDERDELSAEITDIEDKLTAREDLRERREGVTEELTQLRTRIDTIEENAVEAFNSHMETVINVLEYENLARVWIERTETEVREGRRKVDKQMFELHIIRESDEKRVYEDDLSNLSESEREVTGLVFALAGYLVHDVQTEIPFMLLDSLEAIDSDRIAKLIDHFEAYPDYLIAALLEEDADATSDEYTLISDI